eukprot:4902091-Pyramimonas_sp.AAC.1
MAARSSAMPYGPPCLPLLAVVMSSFHSPLAVTLSLGVSMMVMRMIASLAFVLHLSQVSCDVLMMECSAMAKWSSPASVC